MFGKFKVNEIWLKAYGKPVSRPIFNVISRGPGWVLLDDFGHGWEVPTSRGKYINTNT